MKKNLYLITFLILLFGQHLQAQNVSFNRVLKNSLASSSDIVQDHLGIIWIPTFDRGLLRYDGLNTTTFAHDPSNPNSLVNSPILTIQVDYENNIWLGTLGKGLDKFDPATNNFTHYRHKASDPSSLSNDTVICILEDHLKNLWIGTANGLDLMDKKTGKFTHFRNNPQDANSLRYNAVFLLYEDRKGILWVKSDESVLGPENGNGKVSKIALHRFDRKTKKFTSFQKDTSTLNPYFPMTDISVLYEDRKGKFWIGTSGQGLYTMDRNTGKCTRFYPDVYHSAVLSETPIPSSSEINYSFLKEDAQGAFWIGTFGYGILRYDPISNKSTHYGKIFVKDKLVSAKDTLDGFTDGVGMKALNTKDGLFWVISSVGNLYNVNYHSTKIPFFNIAPRGANAFYVEPTHKILWIATDKGLFRKDVNQKTEKKWVHNVLDKNSLINDNISTLRADENGNLWLGTSNGLDKFEPLSQKFTHYQHDSLHPTSINSKRIAYLHFDHNKNLWMATDSGISKMDKLTGKFTHYRPEDKNSQIFPGNFLCIAEDHEFNIWVSSGNGAYKLDPKSGKFRWYLSGSFLKTLCVDKKGIIWAGGTDALYYYDHKKDNFKLFANQQSPIGISAIINIIEDNLQNLWVSTSTSIIKINADRKKIKKYTESNGVNYTNFFYNDNYKDADGRLYLGIGGGYYSFLPEQINDSSIAPQLNIIGFTIGNTKIKTEAGGILSSPIWLTKEIHLHHNQNAFSFDFFATDYMSPGDEKYLFMLENYDDTWHDIGSDRRAVFFNIPPGEYRFKVKVVNGDGAIAEKSISVVISPPWWQTWWAYLVYGILILLIGYVLYKYQKNYILKRERENSQRKELEQAKEIEKAYNDLKITQAQLIQSEKMASLGELTAGIAHEIQNPLNFVNNFSEINIELIGEMRKEILVGNFEEVEAIAKDLEENEGKINHHGKRADAIVKGMLQHSRSNSGDKKDTDINALTDEYLRLAYHGLRAKDKSFNASIKTDFDKRIGSVSLVPQDIGRVILNLVTNAFYVLDEKKKQNIPGYEPTISVSTKSETGKLFICVKDNGNGIPQKVLDKIFQPFFTTKPAGKGTGLGLSLSYDIVKAHGGELKVTTVEGEGTEFTICLPMNT
ncbi:MAG: hypothetical protein IPI46_02395 [Bacteroidetes bacterium]|nr:hypothetical protein [Bacteroidota bacterium]